MASNKPPGVKVPGIRGGIPPGYLLGRVDPGHGDVQLISMARGQSAGLIPASLPGPPTGTAGGDLSGTYPNPTVAKLQGRAVSAAAPANTNVIAWSGAAWAPLALAAVAYSGAYGDLSGLPAIHNVPAGGTAGQALTKVDGTDYNLAWSTISAGSGGGAASIYDDGTNVYVALSDTDGQLVLDGSGDPVFSLEVFPKAAIPAATAPTYTYLTTVTSSNYTPPAGCTRIEVEMKAGGGGGGPYGNPASGGAAGGDASFNSITAIGGAKASTSGLGNPGTGGTGGTGSTGVIRRIPGEDGQTPSLMIWTATNDLILGGRGGGKSKKPFNAGTGQNGTASDANSGAGGTGATGANDTQANLASALWGAGGGEGETVFLFINNPVGPYAYTVPDGGSGLTGGSFNGGKGGSGYILIKEFYD